MMLCMCRAVQLCICVCAELCSWDSLMLCMCTFCSWDSDDSVCAEELCRAVYVCSCVCVCVCAAATQMVCMCSCASGTQMKVWDLLGSIGWDKIWFPPRTLSRDAKSSGKKSAGGIAGGIVCRRYCRQRELCRRYRVDQKCEHPQLILHQRNKFLAIVSGIVQIKSRWGVNC